MTEATDPGYTACDCGKFVHIYRAAVLRQLPQDYSGEACPACGLWMCAINQVEPQGVASPPPAAEPGTTTHQTAEGN